MGGRRIGSRRRFGGAGGFDGPDRFGGFGGERGSGSVLAIGVLGAVVAVAVAVIPVGSILVAHQQASAAADAAALAAADTTSGRISGYPCEVAAAVATRNRATIAACEVQGLIASVTVVVPGRWGDVSVSARAGPPSTRSEAATVRAPQNRFERFTTKVAVY